MNNVRHWSEIIWFSFKHQISLYVCDHFARKEFKYTKHAIYISDKCLFIHIILSLALDWAPTSTAMKIESLPLDMGVEYTCYHITREKQFQPNKFDDSQITHFLPNISIAMEIYTLVNSKKKHMKKKKKHGSKALQNIWNRTSFQRYGDFILTKPCPRSMFFIPKNTERTMILVGHKNHFIAPTSMQCAQHTAQFTPSAPLFIDNKDKKQ